MGSDWVQFKGNTMKKNALILMLLLAVPQITLAKTNIASDFVKSVQKAADSDGIVSASVDIDCPASSASGKVLITKASYEFEKSVGAFIFKNSNDTPAIITSLSTESPNGDFTSNEIIGMSFIFKMSGGQFFVDIFKNGKARAGVNKNGTSGIVWVDCKIIKPS